MAEITSSEAGILISLGFNPDIIPALAQSVAEREIQEYHVGLRAPLPSVAALGLTAYDPGDVSYAASVRSGIEGLQEAVGPILAAIPDPFGIPAKYLLAVVALLLLVLKFL